MPMTSVRSVCLHIFKQVMRWKKQLSPSLTIDLPLDLQVKVLCAQATLYSKQKKLTKAKVRCCVA